MHVGPITALTLIELFLEGEFKLTTEEVDELIALVSQVLERVNDSRSDEPEEEDPI